LDKSSKLFTAAEDIVLKMIGELRSNATREKGFA
jgi:hypothetical protein